MKILIISPYIPWPLYSGASVRIFNIAKQMSLEGHEIVLLAKESNPPIITPQQLTDVFEKIYTYKVPLVSPIFFILCSVLSAKIYPALKFQSADFTKILNTILSEEKIDAIFVNFSLMADMLPEDLHNTTPIILDQHESERLMYSGYLKKGNLKEKIFALINIIKLGKFEKGVFSKINMLVCVSENEAAIAKNYVKKDTKILVVPNGVSKTFFNDITKFTNKENVIVFCANMAVNRNIQAAIWFAKSIFPKIKEKIADAQFQIVGSWPSKEVLKLNSISGVRVIGMVKDIEKYYTRGKVFVAPYHFGAGTKLKVLEAMASGIPVVSTDTGSFGIEVTDKKNIIIANNEIDFCNGVVELLSNSKKAEEIAFAAQDLVKEKYAWEKIVARLDSKILELIAKK